jgi:hypothetical protein
MGTISYIDGFDEYAAADAPLFGWDDVPTAMVAGRIVGQAMDLAAMSISHALDPDATYTASFAVWTTDVGGQAPYMVRFYEGVVCHGGVAYNGDGTFSVRDGNNAVFATSGDCGLANDVPFTVEWKYTVDNAAGAYELRINKVVVIGPTSGVDTRNGGTTGLISKIMLTAPTGIHVAYDDLILTKGGGFQGDLRVVTQMPDGDGANTAWTAVPFPIALQASNSGSGTGAVTLAWPAHIADDVALLFVEAAGGEAVTLTTPSGFTECANSPQATGAGTAGTRIHAYWHRATSAAMASVVIGDAGDHVFGTMLTFRGCIDTGDPVNVTAGAVKTPATTAFSSPTVTTTVGGCLVVAAVARDDDIATAEFSAWANANLVSIAEMFDLGTTSGNGGGIGIGGGIKAAAGATGATTGTVVSSINASITIALVPAPAGDWLQVNDITPNGDVDYLTGSTPGDRDTFTFPDVGVVGTVKAVAINHVSRKDDAGVREIAGSIRIGATNYDGSGLEVSTSWAAYQEIHETDPSTTDPWDVADIDTAEFGIYLDA